MTAPYTPSDWFWQVASDATRWFSSKVGAYVAARPETFTIIASEQELWDVLDAAGIALPNGAAISDERKAFEVDRLDLVALRGLFNHENRIRALEGKQAVTAAQFKVAIKGLL